MSFNIVDKKGNKYGIIDTRDGVVEYYTEEQITHFDEVGIKINKYSNDLGGDIAKQIFLGKEAIIFESDDSRESCFRKVSEKTGDLIVVNRSNISDMTAMFKECKARSIDLSYFDSSKVTSMNSMFAYCKAKVINFTGLDTSKVADMRLMFYFCEANILDLSGFNTRNVTNMSSMFFHCKSKRIDLSSFDIRHVCSYEWMFEDCNAQFEIEDERLDEIYRRRYDKGEIF